MFELEGRDVGAADNFVVCVHVARRAVGLRISDLTVDMYTQKVGSRMN